MTMQVAMIGAANFPYQWTREELPHDLDCSVSMRAGFACMSTLSKNVWVPKGWHESIYESWKKLEDAAWRALAKKVTQSQHQGSRIMAPRSHEKIDHWAIGDALPDDRLSYAIDCHAAVVKFRVEQMSNTRKKPNVVKVTPEQWLTIREQLRVFSVPVQHWSDEQEKERYDELLDFLTNGTLPDEVNMAAKHRPNLTRDQAAGVLWFLNMVTGVDINGIRYSPCSVCGEFCTADETAHCAGCEVSMCEDCFRSHSGSGEFLRDRDAPDWPESLDDDDCYCEKCVALVERHLLEQAKVEGPTA